tara:strand:+ start:766 stop:1224 length:459 start_codon:yes stop_codon:yes gene_type:complete
MLDIQKILNELKLLPEYDKQIMLQGVNSKADHSYGTGRLDDIDNSVKEWEQDFKEFLFPELEYVNFILKKLNMTRTRVMKMAPKTCYSYHQDPSKRVHIPLITNEKCFFVVADEVIRLPADGNYYVIDTTKLHTFVNASFEDRIHIVGCQYD